MVCLARLEKPDPWVQWEALDLPAFLDLLGNQDPQESFWEEEMEKVAETSSVQPAVQRVPRVPRDCRE